MLRSRPRGQPARLRSDDWVHAWDPVRSFRLGINGANARHPQDVLTEDRQDSPMTMQPSGAHSERQCLRVAIRGAVQGVGFRPFIFRLASELGLAGWVNNSVQGVFLEVEGPRSQLEQLSLIHI